MRESLKRFWDKIKWGLFLIIYTAGVVGWMYFYQEFKIIRCEANWAYSEAVKIHNQEDDGKEVGDRLSPSTSMQVSPEAATADQITVALPSDSIEKIIYEVFGDEYKTARAVAYAESRLRPEAINTNTNGTTDCGVFQINSIHRLEDCQDPIKNITYAKQLFDRSGWRPWVAYTTGKYLAYL